MPLAFVAFHFAFRLLLSFAGSDGVLIRNVPNYAHLHLPFTTLALTDTINFQSLEIYILKLQPVYLPCPGKLLNQNVLTRYVTFESPQQVISQESESGSYTLIWNNLDAELP